MAAKDVVRQGYDTIASTYLQWITSRPSAQVDMTKLILGQLTQGSKVLDLGCGAGVPVAKLLCSEGHHVTGVDISEKQIELAQQYVPNAEFKVADMASLVRPDSSFDAVLAFYSVFHLPREQHEDFVRKTYSWLRPEGLLLINFAPTAMGAQISKFHGADNFFSGWSTSESQKLVADAGFDIVQTELRAQGDVDNPDDPDNGVSFFWVLARKPA